MYRKRSVLLSAGLAVALAIAVIAAVSAWDRVGPVSYTHLTLPTNREV